MVVYTKKGDKGETSLYDSQNAQVKRVSKDSLRVWAIGSVDEVNSFLGICITFSEDYKLVVFLKEIQTNLFTIGSLLSGANLDFPLSNIKKLEREIDKMEGDLPVLKNFILPGGSQLSAHLQYNRALTRRAERRIVALNKVEQVNPQILKFINRLSDYFFVLARNINYKLGSKDEVWQGKRR